MVYSITQKKRLASDLIVTKQQITAGQEKTHETKKIWPIGWYE